MKRRKYLPKVVDFYCNWDGVKFFNFVHDKRYVRDYGDKNSKFVSVVLREPTTTERSDYFAWWDNDAQDYLCISQSKKALDRCLNDPEEMEKRGEGERINIIVELVDEYCYICCNKVDQCTCSDVDFEEWRKGLSLNG